LNNLHNILGLNFTTVVILPKKRAQRNAAKRKVLSNIVPERPIK